MALLRFILGRAGAGKTYTCLADIAQLVEKSALGSPLIFLVPDQATFQVEKALTSLLPSRGFSRVQVLSFNRLSFAILSEIGGIAKPELSPLGRQMLLRALLLQQRDQLQVFGRAARQPGFITKLEAALQEMSRYNHNPDQAKKVSHGLQQGSVVQKKLTDLTLLWQAFQTALADREAGFDEHLKNAAMLGPHAGLVQNAQVWVDGFASFTPLEHELLLMLVRHADAVHLALCMDPATWPHIDGTMSTSNVAGWVNPLSLFHRTEATCAEILLAARAAGVPVEQPKLLSAARRFVVPELSHLEVEFDRTVPKAYPSEPQAICVVEAANRRAEVEAVGRDILRLCRDKGYRYRDIAIVTRNLNPYHEVLTAVFRDMGIPIFIDKRASVAHHPVVELLRSALEVVLSRWDIRPLVRCLKTDLLPFQRDEIDALENYALEHGLRGSVWRTKEPWQYGLRFREADPVRIEQVQHFDQLRRQIAAQFVPLEQCFAHRQITVGDGCVALYSFLQQAGVAERLQNWADTSAMLGALQDSLTHQQVWDACMELLEQMHEALGSTLMSSNEFSQVLEAGLENLHLGLIPPALDQVLVGSIDRSRQPHLRAAYVLGVGERSFPATGSEDSMFTDSERELLQSAGFGLGPTSADQALQEQYLGYIALTRAAEYLWVSYPLAGDDGRALSASPFIARLRAAFPQLRLQTVGNEPNGSVAEAIPWLTSPRRVAAVAVRSIQQGGASTQADWSAAFSVLAGDAEALFIKAALDHTHAESHLLPSVALALAGTPLRSSISRLESFAACPFQHFAQHLLMLRERPEFRVQFTDIGLLVHETLHRFVQELQHRQIDWATLNENTANNMADELVDAVAPRLRSEVFMSTARYQYLVARMKRVLHTVLWVWARHAQRGQYRPLATEMPFGPSSKEGALPQLEVTLPDGQSLCVHGRIDRIDACSTEAATYLRVVDYKGGSTGFSVIDLYHGLRLQLIVYLNVVLRAAKTGQLTTNASGNSRYLPGGAYYFNVREPYIDTTKPLDPSQHEKELLKGSRLKGLTLNLPEAIKMAEADGSGQLIPASLNKDGSPASRALCVPLERMEQLFATAEERMATFAGRILAGEVNTEPYRYPSGQNACRFCRYHVVCHFDPQITGNRYRPLDYRENRRAWDLFSAPPVAIEEEN